MNVEYLKHKTGSAPEKAKDPDRKRAIPPGQNPRQNVAPARDLYRHENRLNPLVALPAGNQVKSKSQPDSGNPRPLAAKKIAILVANGFEQQELEKPRRALEEAGATTFVISPEHRVVTSWNQTKRGTEFKVDSSLESAHADDFDGLLLPGGVTNVAKLRSSDEACHFVRDLAQKGKPIAAICHGPALLAQADCVHGRHLTGCSRLKSDLIKAGAEWVDQPAVADHTLVTGREFADLHEFIDKMIGAFSEEFLSEVELHPA